MLEGGKLDSGRCLKQDMYVSSMQNYARRQGMVMIGKRFTVIDGCVWVGRLDSGGMFGAGWVISMLKDDRQGKVTTIGFWKKEL